MKSISRIAAICKPVLDSLISNRVFTTTIMGSDTCRKHFQHISSHLTEFEKKPKEIDGNRISEWFNVGESLFEELYNLGTSVKWNYAAIKEKETEVSDVVSRVSKNQGWLQSFISIYPGLRVDLEGATGAADVCRVRSGIELLLRGFAGVNRDFDKVLSDLEKLGELEEFDDHLKEWKAGHRPDFFPGDIHRDTPKSHWWWY